MTRENLSAVMFFFVNIKTDPPELWKVVYHLSMSNNPATVYVYFARRGTPYKIIDSGLQYWGDVTEASALEHLNRVIEYRKKMNL